jgi:hypothetical protein
VSAFDLGLILIGGDAGHDRFGGGGRKWRLLGAGSGEGNGACYGKKRTHARLYGGGELQVHAEWISLTNSYGTRVAARMTTLSF